MLFKSSITHETIKDQDKLVEQLYIFLNPYVKSRLYYLGSDNVEDCIQDTIMHILKRISKLDNTSDITNYEKFIYNRTNSYVSYWLRNYITYSEPLRVTSDTYPLASHEPTPSQNNYIDYDLIKSLAEEFVIDDITKVKVIELVKSKLVDVGFDSVDISIPSGYSTLEETISNNIVDEYLIVEARVVNGIG